MEEKALSVSKPWKPRRGSAVFVSIFSLSTGLQRNPQPGTVPPGASERSFNEGGRAATGGGAHEGAACLAAIRQSRTLFRREWPVFFHAFQFGGNGDNAAENDRFGKKEENPWMKIRALVVGTGGFGRYHLRRMLACSKNTTIVGLIETSEEQREKTRQLFAEMKAPCPPFHETIRDFLKAGGKADAAVIVTPHRYHLEHALACLRAGMDVLMEKPMVLDVREARRLIRERDRLGRMLVVAFPSSLSPALRRAREMIETGRIGRVSAISAAVHQRWKQATAGLWRQVPEISGGGFLFDTGSHLVNAMLELGGDEVSEVHAFMDHAGTPVEITSAGAAELSPKHMIAPSPNLLRISFKA